MKKLLGTLSAIAALMTAIAFIGCKQPSNEEDETMLLELSFEDFTATSVKITYGHNDDDTVVDGVVSSDGKSATATLSSEYMNSDGWMVVKKIEVNNDDGKISVECTSSDMWFAFEADGKKQFTYKLADSNVTPLPYETDYTGTGSLIKILTGATFADKAISKLTVVFSEITLPEGVDNDSGDAWISLCGDASWAKEWKLNKEPFSADDGTFTCNIPGDEEDTYAIGFIEAVKENGLYIAGTSGFTCKIKVSVTETK
ncbi:MAG: hypothetical protein J1F14_06650 [Treponema sp.]|nr:hypothetical protein [Treponema sp.]